MGIALLLAIGIPLILYGARSKSLQYGIDVELAQKLHSEGRSDEAQARVAPYFSSHADDLNLLRLRLGLCFDLGLADDAEKVARKLHELQPSRASAYFLAFALHDVARFDEAIGLLQSNDPIEGFEGRHFALLGDCFLGKGNATLAIEALKRGPVLKRSLDDDLLQLHYSLGKAYLMAGQKANGKKHLERILAHDATFRDVSELVKDL